MGGSLDGHGNVVDPCFDGTAEWNAFWDPEAVKRVWDSSLEIHMVGLELSLIHISDVHVLLHHAV